MVINFLLDMTYLQQYRMTNYKNFDKSDIFINVVEL